MKEKLIQSLNLQRNKWQENEKRIVRQNRKVEEAKKLLTEYKKKRIDFIKSVNQISKTIDKSGY